MWCSYRSTCFDIAHTSEFWRAKVQIVQASLHILPPVKTSSEHHNSVLCEMLDIRYPIIMAPMFLVSDVKMVQAAAACGITGAIPALNYRTKEELRAALNELKSSNAHPFGINLIVNKSNFKFEEQLDVCCEVGVDYFITSLGNPKKVIEESHKKGIKVFCDVTDLKYALKVQELGADAVIAVNNEAGGHAGKLVISAGGVGDADSLQQILNLGADGVSVGSIFIASEEAPVSRDYKQAVVEYGEKDVVMTTKLSGTPCTVINTPYMQEIGTEQSKFEALLNKNKRLKKWFKALTFIRGMDKLRNAAFSATYKTVWCAGPSISHVHTVRPISQIVKDLVDEKES